MARTDPDISPAPPATERGRRTRRKLLDAATIERMIEEKTGEKVSLADPALLAARAARASNSRLVES